MPQPPKKEDEPIRYYEWMLWKLRQIEDSDGKS